VLFLLSDISGSVANYANQKSEKHLRQQILTTCGDADVMVGTKNIDPVLCIYIGVYLTCIDNKHLKDKVPRGNGTMCRVIGIKLKQDPQSYK
jgi:hypothetical protein